MLLKLLANTRTFVKIVVPLITPLFIAYATFDILRFFQVDLGKRHFLASVVDFQAYSVLLQGFKPLLQLPDAHWASAIDCTLLCAYAIASLCSLAYACLFYAMCVVGSYDRRWQSVHHLIANSVKA